MKKFCGCGKLLHKQTRGDRCRKCATKHMLRAGARPSEAEYLVDVPRMSDDEYDIIMDVDNEGEPPVLPTERADAIVRRGVAAVRTVKDRLGILDK